MMFSDISQNSRENHYVLGFKLNQKRDSGTGISRTNTVKMRPHPSATTVDICDYIKPEYVTNPM